MIDFKLTVITEAEISSESNIKFYLKSTATIMKASAPSSREMQTHKVNMNTDLDEGYENIWQTN